MVCPILRPYKVIVIFLIKKDNQEFKKEFGFSLNFLGIIKNRI